MPGGYCGKSHKEIKRIKKFIAETNQRYSEKFVELSREEIGRCQCAPEKAWRNKNYLVYLYHDREFLRLCVQRTTIKDDGSFEDGISWDRIQQIKSAIGFGDYWGLEVFPADKSLVNVSNIRHIWLFEERPAFAWSGKDDVTGVGA